jgi:hypothetical protein
MRPIEGAKWWGHQPNAVQRGDEFGRSVIVIFKLMANGCDDNVIVFDDLEQSHIAGSAKSDDQRTKKWAVADFAACKGRLAQRSDAFPSQPSPLTRSQKMLYI